MLELKNVWFKYPKSNRYVLENINAQFCSGILNVVVGLNGAGKTTLFDLIAGVYKRPHGFYNVPHQRDIVYQLQGLPFPGQFKGKDVVKLFLRLGDNRDHKFDPNVPLISDTMTEREKELMKRLWNTYLGHMSMGERRWLLISSMCELNRKLYIFDEPTTGIDPYTRTNILYRLQSLAKKHDTTVIMSTHNLHELEFLECKMFFLHNGIIHFQGTYSEFLSIGNTDNPDDVFEEFVHAGR